MADPKTFSVDIPAEPPDMSVVAVPFGDKLGAGRVWMRDDPAGHKGPGAWYPAGDAMPDGLPIVPLSFRVLLGVYGDLTVLRWGKGPIPGGES